MPSIKPFKALRPNPELAQLVSSKSWDSNHNHISRSIMETYDYSYLHVVKPHLNFTDKERIPEKHYPFARHKLEDMIKLHILVKENRDCFYLYRITDLKLGYSYVGFVGLASVDDYLSGKIKVHEHTLSKKEEALVKHIDYVKAIGEPVLLTFKGGDWYEHMLAQVLKDEPMFNFVCDELVRSEIWPVSDPGMVKAMQENMKTSGALYIADGHHRSAGAVRYCKAKREENPGFTGEEAFNYFLAYFIPTDKLRIFEFNRLVKDLGGLSREAFLEKLKENFRVEEIGKAPLQVNKKDFRFGMYMDNSWYGLDLHEEPEGNVLHRLDVSILENLVLKNILGIYDSKTDDRLSFVDGTKGIHRLQELVDIGEFRVAFSLFPTRIEEVLEVSDLGLTMPPKSTWFEPKLRTGLLIYEVDEKI